VALAPSVKFWADEYFVSPRAGLYLQAGITFLNAWVIAATRAPCPDRQKLP